MLRTPARALVVSLSLLLPAPLAAQAAPVPGLAVHYDVPGRSPADRFGAAVDAVGDLNGDGVVDWIAGAPHADGGGPSTGAVRVASGREGKVLYTLRGSAPGGWFGYAVAGTGDVDADGVADFAVGAPLASPPAGASAGEAHVFSGRTGAVLWVWTGSQPGARFGQTVCAAGDLDADGFADVAVGAPYADGLAGPSAKHAGRVQVFSGRDGSMLLDVGGSASDFFGLALDGAGDANGDGRDDLLVGAPFSDAQAFNGGSAYVLSGLDGAVLQAFHGAGIGDQFGHWVANVGDADADDVSDFALAAPGTDVVLESGALRIDAGIVELRSGGDGAWLWSLAGDFEGAGLGQVAAVGDVDGDQHADVGVGVPSEAEDAGRVLIVSGLTGQPLASHLGKAPLDWLGYSLSGLGDIDGDGWPEFVVGAPGHDDELGLTGYVRVLTALALPSLTHPGSAPR